MDGKDYKLSPEDRKLLAKDLYQRLGSKTLVQDMNTSTKEKPIDILKNLVNCNLKDDVKKVLNYNIHSHMEDYHLYRYIAFWLESKERNKDIRHSIASWMVQSRHEDLPFNDIFVIDDEVYIYTYRPGLWIGKGGCTINDCLYHINHKIDGTEYRKLNIHLIEAKDDAITDVYGYMRALNVLNSQSLINL